MSKLDAVLEEIWDRTTVADAPAAFNAAVLERLARRRTLQEVAMAAVIAVAIFAVALGLGPALAAEDGLLAGAILRQPVTASLAIIACGLGVFAALRMFSAIERGFWSMGLLR